MVQRGFEDEAGNELKPFHDRVVRAGEEGFADSARDTIMLNADAAFAGMPNWDSANDEGEAGGISNRQARRTGLKRQGQLVEESDDGWRHAPVRPHRMWSCRNGSWRSRTRWRTAITAPVSTTRSRR